MNKIINFRQPFSNFAAKFSFSVLFATSFFVLHSASTEAQGRFQLKRTKSEGIPVIAVLFGGYNGMNDPAEIIQDNFDHTNLSSNGGVMIGVQGAIRLDTTVLPVWSGLELYYHRIAKRWTMDREEIHFPDEEGRVDAVETMGGYGGHVLLILGPIARLSLILGGGVQYLNSTLDIDAKVIGTFGSHWVPSGIIGIIFNMLNYDHGSIDLQIRGMKGFNEYGSFQLQSLLGFTFSFK